MLKRIGMAILLLVAAGVAEDAPKVNPELRAKFWRAQAEQIATQMQAQRADEHFRAVQAELSKACGTQPVVAGADGEPMCAVKPPEAQKAR
jgi:hypothetical protein